MPELQHQTQLISLIQKYKDASNFPEKKEYVLDIIGVVETMIDNKVLNIEKSDISAFIKVKFDEYGVDISSHTIERYCKDNQKRNYSISEASRIHHEHNFAGNKYCTCGALKMDGLIFTKEENTKQNKSKEEMDATEQNDPFENSFTEYLTRVSHNAKGLAGISNDIIKKYFAEEQNATDIKSSLLEAGNIGKMNKEQKEIESKLIYLGDLLDARNRIGEFEKIMAKLLMDTTHKIAHVAKLLGISPKHGSNNIGRKDRYKKLEWFRSCPSCGDDIADTINQYLRDYSDSEDKLPTAIPVPK